MTFAWVLNTASLFAMAAGSLLFFLSLWQPPRAADDELATEEERRDRQKHIRLYAIGGGVLSLWFVMQYLGAILL